MRFAWVTACGFAAWTAASWATGLVPQPILTWEYRWLWWVPAGVWTFTAFLTALGWGDD